MPREAFLINPPRRVKRKTTAKRKSTKRKLPSGFSRSKAKRITVYKTGERSYARSPFSPSKQAGISVNPYGEEVIVVGKNPRRRRRRKGTKRRARRINPAMSMATVRRRRSNPVRRKRRKVSRRRRNPVMSTRRMVRRRRRNPAMSLAVGSINFKRPMTLIMPVATGIASNLVTNKAPDALGLTGNMRYLAKAAVGIVGGIVLKNVKMVGSTNAMIWAVVALANVTAEILKDKVGGPMFSGYGAFVDYEGPRYLPGAAMGDFVDDEQFGAFVDNEMDPFAPSDVL